MTLLNIEPRKTIRKLPEELEERLNVLEGKAAAAYKRDVTLDARTFTHGSAIEKLQKELVALSKSLDNSQVIVKRLTFVALGFAGISLTLSAAILTILGA